RGPPGGGGVGRLRLQGLERADGATGVVPPARERAGDAQPFEAGGVVGLVEGPRHDEHRSAREESLRRRADPSGMDEGGGPRKELREARVSQGGGPRGELVGYFVFSRQENAAAAEAADGVDALRVEPVGGADGG